MTGSTYCEHDRTRVACEDCAYNAAKAAGRPVLDVAPAVTVEDDARRQAEVLASDPVAAGSLSKAEADRVQAVAQTKARRRR